MTVLLFDGGDFDQDREGRNKISPSARAVGRAVNEDGDGAR